MTYVKFLKHMAIESVRHIKDKVSPTEFAVAYLELLRETVAHPEMVAFSAAAPGSSRVRPSSPLRRRRSLP